MIDYINPAMFVISMVLLCFGFMAMVGHPAPRLKAVRAIWCTAIAIGAIGVFSAAMSAP